MTIPYKYVIILCAVIGALVGGGASIIRYGHTKYVAGVLDGRQSVQIKWDREKMALQEQATKDRAAKAEADQENQREVQKLLDRAAADSAALQRSSDRMRQRIQQLQQLAGMCQGAPQDTSGPGFNPGQAVDLLTRMSEGSATMAVDIARYADALQADLQACRGQPK